MPGGVQEEDANRTNAGAAADCGDGHEEEGAMKEQGRNGDGDSDHSGEKRIYGVAGGEQERSAVPPWRRYAKAYGA